MNPPASALLRDRAVVALLVTTLCATGAAVTQVTALGITVYDLTRSDLDLGLLGLAEFVPAFLLVLVTGSVADRFDRRRLVAAGLLGEVVCSAALVALALGGNASTTPIFAIVVAFGVARAFLAPATRSLPADNAPPGALPRLVAFNSASWQVALIGGPVLAGLLYTVGPEWPFVACIVLAATGTVAAQLTLPTRHDAVVALDGATTDGEVGAVALVELADEQRPAEALDQRATPELVPDGPVSELEPDGARAGGEVGVGSDVGLDGRREAVRTGGPNAAPSPTRTSGEAPDQPLEPGARPTPLERLREAAQGLVVIRRDKVLLGAISLDLFAVLFGGAVALLPAIADERLGVDASGIGWLRAAGGIGAAAMTLWLTVHPVRRHVGHWLFAMVAAFGVATIVLGLTRSFVVAFLAMLVLSGADAVSVYIRSTIVPLVTPPRSRGRVLAVEGVFVGASNELGAFESGVVGAVLGTTVAVVTGGAATLAVVAIWMAAFPALRRIDRFSELRPGTG